MKQNKDAIINCAFGVAMTLSNLPASIGGVLGSIASEGLVKCSGKIANFLVGAIVSDLVESAGSLGGLSKKLYFRSDSFKTVRDKIYKIYKTDIDIILYEKAEEIREEKFSVFTFNLPAALAKSALKDYVPAIPPAGSYTVTSMSVDDVPELYDENIPIY